MEKKRGRNGFMFFRSFYEAVEKLPREDRLEVFEAVMAYGLDGEMPELSGTADAVFTLMKPNLDSGWAKAINGQRGGLSRVRKTLAPLAEQPEQPKRGPSGGQAKEEEKKKDMKQERELEQEKEDPAVAALVSLFLDRVNPEASERCLDELRGFAQEMGTGCCRRAIDAAVDAKKVSWAYIRAILRAKMAQGVRCLEDWDRLEEGRARRCPQSGGGKWDLPAVEL